VPQVEVDDEWTRQGYLMHARVHTLEASNRSTILGKQPKNLNANLPEHQQIEHLRRHQKWMYPRPPHHSKNVMDGRRGLPTSAAIRSLLTPFPRTYRDSECT